MRALQELRETRQQCAALRDQLQTLLATAAPAQSDAETEEKLKSAEAERQQLVEEQAKMKEEFDKWKEQFKEQNEGQEPTEEDRCEKNPQGSCVQWFSANTVFGKLPKGLSCSGYSHVTTSSRQIRGGKENSSSLAFPFPFRSPSPSDVVSPQAPLSFPFVPRLQWAGIRVSLSKMSRKGHVNISNQSPSRPPEGEGQVMMHNIQLFYLRLLQE